jgi:hypothetical protein
MKKKDRKIFDFILREVGIEITPFLESLIANPQKLSTLNNMALEQVVKEFAPVYKKYKHFLDGPHELTLISSFEISLMWRLNNKPELRKILDN